MGVQLQLGPAVQSLLVVLDLPRAEDEPSPRRAPSGAAGDSRHAGPGHGPRGTLQLRDEPQAQLVEEEDPAGVFLHGARLRLPFEAVQHGLRRPAPGAPRLAPGPGAARPLALLPGLAAAGGRRGPGLGGPAAAAARSPPPAELRCDGRDAPAPRLGDGHHPYRPALLPQPY